jgi:hypothetical protein
MDLTLYYLHLLYHGLPHPYHVLEKMENNPGMPRKVKKIVLHYSLLLNKFPEMSPKNTVAAMSHISGISKNDISYTLKRVAVKGK